MTVPFEAFLLAGLLFAASLATAFVVEALKMIIEGLRGWDHLPVVAALVGAVITVCLSPVLTTSVEQIFGAVQDGELMAYSLRMGVLWACIGLGVGMASAGLFRYAKQIGPRWLIEKLK